MASSSIQAARDRIPAFFDGAVDRGIRPGGQWLLHMKRERALALSGGENWKPYV